MSQSIPQNHVQQFKDNVIMLAQQKGSRLRATVRDDGDIVGDRVYFDRIGATAAQKVTTRHGDTPLMNTPHSRRMAPMFDYDWGDLVDKTDKLKTLYDPTNKYSMAAQMALGRSMDDEIIGALGGSAAEGVDGSSSIALPSSQKVLAAAGGLTKAKLISSKELLDAAEVDDDVERFIVTTARQISNLLNDTEITSSDYNTVKALVQGQIDTFMGFTFKRTERLLTDGSGDRLCYAYAATAVGLGVPQDIEVDIGPRRDKRNATQVYACMGLGAVRVEDVQVVEIACVEA